MTLSASQLSGECNQQREVIMFESESECPHERDEDTVLDGDGDEVVVPDHAFS